MNRWLVLLSASVLAVTAAPAAQAAEPAASTGPNEFRDCPDVCPAMVRIPAGRFQMGSASPYAEPDEKPVHAVTVPAFAAGAYEVTQAEFAAFVAATGFTAPPGCLTDRPPGNQFGFYPDATWREPGLPTGDRLPVVCVNWADANAYTAWLSKKTGHRYRLLSEAEWEYAARAGTTTDFWWGDSPDAVCANANGVDVSAKARYPRWAAVDCDDGQVVAAPAGSFRPNPFGLYDMSGNVMEWTADCYEGDYDAQPRDGRAYEVKGCFRRVLRGGSWGTGIWQLRSAARFHIIAPTLRGGDVGFRVARDL
jgi:formylglycine-generating enzyme required for sulfatase activity